MEDVIGFKAMSSNQRWVGFLTFGRLWGPLETEQLENAIRDALPSFGIDRSAEVYICESLQHLRSCPYFYEGLLSFAWRPISFGSGYDAWRQKQRDEVGTGSGVYCVGEVLD